MDLRIIAALANLLFLSSARAEVEVALESLCVDCSLQARRRVAEIAPPRATNGKIKTIYVYLPARPASAHAENIVFHKVANYVATSDFGGRLVRAARGVLEQTPGSALDFRLFHHLAFLSDTNSFEPLWVQERREPHDLYGFYTVHHQAAVIGLNNYQYRHNAPFTFLHELFHLVDSHETRAADADLVRYITELRAHFAELELYQELRVGKVPSLDLPEFKKSAHYERFLGWWKVDVEAVADFVMELEFPTKIKERWEFDKTAKICEFIGKNKPVCAAGKNADLYQWLAELAMAAQGSPEKERLLILQYRKSAELPELKDHNQRVQRKLHGLIEAAGGLEAWIEKESIRKFDLFRKQGWNSPAAGGGPKGRDDGD